MSARLPRKIRAGYLTYSIVRLPRAEIHPRFGEPDEMDGFTHHESRTIAIARELSPDDARETLLHEIEHLVVKLAFPAFPAWLRRHEEQYVYQTAGPRLQLLRDNPGLVGFLLDDN